MNWKSSLLQAARYQQKSAILEVALHGGTAYRYFDVPAQTYQHLLEAPSKGGYFNSHIRNRFTYTKILSLKPSD